MKKLLEYILEEITGKTSFTIEESEENGTLVLQIEAESEDIGMIIGKGGKTIKSIQELLRVRGKIENNPVFVNVREKSS